MEKEKASPDTQPPPSLFPISSTSNAVVTATAPPQWLNSSSFTTDLSIIAAAATAAAVTHTDEEEEKEIVMKAVKPPSYELLESSEERENQKKKKKKKRKREREGRGSDRDREAFGYGGRKSSIGGWDNKTLNSKDYYFDSRGDPDNLAFGSLYKMDIRRYKLHDAGKSFEIDFKGQSQFGYRGLLAGGELDVDGLDCKLKSSGRYWSAKHSILEKQRNFKHIRVVAPEKHVQVLFNDYIPLSDDEDEDDSLLSKPTVILESWEDQVLRKTKDFNKKTREQPHNVKVWLDFAEFQDKIASNQPQKGARLQTLEKKISILEKAAELNPDDEDVLLYLLKTYQNRDSADVLIGRWEKILMQHSGNCKLWREFLRVVQGDFSTFKVSELRRMYAHAIQALYAALSKRHRQVHPTVEPTSAETVDTDLEMGIVDIYLSLCRFEWQAGYQELATALLQAEIEYALFSPPLQLTEQSKKRLFEHFWNSNGARVGETGALGWCTWLEKEEENRQNLMQEMYVEEEQGGWTGWFVPPSKGQDNSPNIEEGAINDVGAEEVDEQDDMSLKQEEDDAALMRMLGIDIDAEASKEVHDTNTWVRWSEEESSRDHDQWMPVRIDSGLSRSKEAKEEEQEQLSRVILFEDVSEFLFSLRSADVRLSLVLQFFDFFGGEISQWFCTNSSWWNEKLLSLETTPLSIIRYLESVNVELLGSDLIIHYVESLLPYSKNGERTEIMKFLRNAALLCLKVFPRNYKIEEAILLAEEKAFEGIHTAQSTIAPSQALAKHLLKSDRQDVLLCGIYARREAAYGNIGHARKVFDLALTSISGLPLESQSIAAPLLYLWYSEMEIADAFTNDSESTSRALHILSCLGSSLAYTPYKGRPSTVQLLRAHQGFREHIRTIRSSWTRHVIEESSVALICSASLFEELTAGWVAGVEVISDALSMVLPECKSRTYQIEFLFNFQLKMLQKHVQQATLSNVLQFVSKGLQVYPFNPDIFRCLVHLGHHYTVPSKLRRIFDELFQRKPSVILCLFSLSFELSRGAPQHRIHGLFERALTNDQLHSNVLLWRCYISYEIYIHNFTAARRVFFRAIHACPWSKILWLDGFQKLHNIVTAKELLDLQKVLQDKELNLRTDIYEILLHDEFDQMKYKSPTL